MLKKIDHINVVVSNLDEAKKFFSQLGFSIGDEAELKGEWVSKIVSLEDVKARYVTLSLPGLGTNLELIEYYSPPSECDPNMSKANQLGFRHIAFEVDNIEETVQNMKRKGIEFISSIQTCPKTCKQLVYFWGPDGILLELAEYPT
jgi:catechol 2,3-dioxygenase-like lactoylglutathione lyase family enzyme